MLQPKWTYQEGKCFFLNVVFLQLLVSGCTAGPSRCAHGKSSDGSCKCSGLECFSTAHLVGLIFGVVGLAGMVLYFIYFLCRRFGCCTTDTCYQCLDREHGLSSRDIPLMNRSQWESDIDVQITSSPDSVDATSYTLTWTVEVNSADIPVRKFRLMYRKVEVMPDMVYGEYRLRRHLEARHQRVEYLSAETRHYTIASLQRDSFYEVKLITVYINGQRKTKLFIFKTSHADQPDIDGNLLSTPMVSENMTENYDPDFRYGFVADHMTTISGSHVTPQVADFDGYLTEPSYSYSDPPPSYEEAMQMSNKTETTI